MKRYTNTEDSAEDLYCKCILLNYNHLLGKTQAFLKHYYPANIFYSPEQLGEYGKILENVDKDPSIRQKYTDQQLWKMRYVVDSNIHPQLKEPVNILFRTSTFVPVNVPLAFGLAVLPPTPINQLLAQSANQTYNFMFNYCNRNASNVFSNEMLAFSYGGAVSSAVVGSLGTSWLFKKLNAPALLIRACPLFGVLIANTFNLFFARYPDFQKGIQVFDDETQEPLPGLSKEAAKIAFFRTLVTRYILPLPMFIPPIVIYYMKQAKCYPQGRAVGLALDLSLSGFFLYCGLSVGIGIFPQYLKVSPTDLESQYNRFQLNVEFKKDIFILKYFLYNFPKINKANVLKSNKQQRKQDQDNRFQQGIMIIVQNKIIQIISQIKQSIQIRVQENQQQFIIVLNQPLLHICLVFKLQLCQLSSFQNYEQIKIFYQ